MAKLPDPPPLATLRSLTPPTIVLPAGTPVARVYFASGSHPVAWNDFRHWGPLGHARFDHHAPDVAGDPCLQDRGVLYCAQSASTCLAEVFQHSRVIDRTRRDPYLVVFTLARPVRLLDLTGAFATKMGASLAIHSGPRDRTRRWAVALYDAFNYEGLRYCSSMHPGATAFTFTQHARSALPSTPDYNRPLADPTLTSDIDACTADLGYLKS